MLVRLLNFFRGYVSVLVRGHFIERFINVCIHRDIYLWDIKRKNNAEAGMKMSLNGFRQLRPIAKKTHTRVHIQKKYGLPILLHRYRKRYFFFGGLVVCMLFVFIMSQFVWSIEVTGNERVPTQQILMTLEQLGFKEGSYRGGVDVVDLKNNVLFQMDSLSWIWVDIRGSKAYVSVKEKTPAPTIVPKDQPCDIVARKAGVIKTVNAKSGKSAVAPGETVQEGQILVSGLVTSEKPEVPARYEHATGEVFARTWYEKGAEYSPTREVRTPTGAVKKQHRIKIFGKTINFYGNSSIPYENYDKITYDSDWHIGKDNYLGITWQTDVYSECDVTYEPVSLEENLAKAEEELGAQILQEVGEGAQEVARQLSHQEAADGTVSVRLTMEFTEQIGAQQQIENPMEIPAPVPTGTPVP